MVVGRRQSQTSKETATESFDNRFVERDEAALSELRPANHTYPLEAADWRCEGLYADKIQHQGPITIDLAVQWAKSTGNNAPIHSARRLDLIRGFAQYRALFDPRTEIPAQGILGPSRYLRKAPYIYTDQEITALQTAASTIRSKIGLTPKAYETLFGLLACTGLRVSEALALTNADVNLEDGILKIRGTKFQKSRLVPLHVSAVAALRGYSEFRNLLQPPTCT